MNLVNLYYDCTLEWYQFTYHEQCTMSAKIGGKENIIICRCINILSAILTNLSFIFIVHIHPECSEDQDTKG
jgi:hypothetical protein